MVDYGKVTPLLVKGMQEQQAEIETLESSIQEQKTQIQSLQKTIATLVSQVESLKTQAERNNPGEK
jgi:septal ring factor EnvC (AmiA/AmiB activator)